MYILNVMSDNRQNYLNDLQRQDLSRSSRYPQPLPYYGPYGGMNFDKRRKKLVHEAYVQSEIEMRLMMEAEERALNEHSQSSLSTDGGAPPEQQTYLSVVRNTYPAALLSETFGSKTLNFIQSTFGYNPSDVLVAESICSDDINAPVFSGNLGQFPDSMTLALNPFMAGGIGGYPHTGVTGLAAWISHVTTGGALFLFSAPHIGVSTDGTIGSVKRRGQNGRLNTSCGAVRAAIDTVLGGWTPSLSGASPIFTSASVYNDYQQNTLTSILYNNRATLSATPVDNQMIVATEMIRVASYNWINANLSTAYAAVSGGVGTPDVYFATGTMINVDDGYSGLMQVDTFQKFSANTGWTDYTNNYLAAITP